MNNDKQGRGIALLPMVAFIGLYLGFGVYYQYINPVEGGLGFYIMSIVVALMVGFAIALVQNNSLTFQQKIHLCAQSIGDDTLMIMIVIFILAGMFSGTASASGGAESAANMLLSLIPASFALPGLFVIGCIISMSMGTSVGTITVLAPIAVYVAENSGMDMAFCMGAVVGGAMFGDNLSFISDTTIAATSSQGVEMRDKFRANIKVACPAALVTLVVLVVYSMTHPAVGVGTYDYNVLQAMPYFVVLVLALIGINVFLVLGCGIVLGWLAGIATGTLGISNALSAMGDGASGMFETIMVAFMVTAIAALVREYGGLQWIVNKIDKVSHSRRGGMLGIGFLTMLVDVCTANNTVAIVVTTPMANMLRERFNIDRKQVAFILDTFSCVAQGIIPYGAQLLTAATLCGLNSVQILPYLFYPYILFICCIFSILFMKDEHAKGDGEEPVVEA